MSSLDERLCKALQSGVVDALPRGHAREVDIVRLSDVEPEPVAWLWRDRIPLGKITMLVGDPGTGKSFITLALAAALTNGQPLPDDGRFQPPCNVILWNGEDGIEDTIRLRGDAVGIDPRRMFVIRGAIGSDGEPTPFSLRDVAALGAKIDEVGDVSLVIIDPVAALLQNVDSYRDADVRSALQPLLDLSRQRRIAVLAVMHLRKSEAQTAIYRVGGSIGFVGLARSVLLAGASPEDGRRAVAPIKSNLGKLAAPIEYSIEDSGAFRWGATATDLGPEHLLSAKTDNFGRRDAEIFLRDALANGPRSSREVSEEGETLGIPPRTLARARQRLGIIAERVGGTAEKGCWMLRMP